ncbi:MAG: antibiotic biosynthesis monooxygenase [Burkholderiales bacterium]|nr:antibiotic biosynthesis monooxygenase [Burkholderiales bacterium]
MYIVTVMLHVDSRHADAFRARVVDNAQTSRRREPGCLQFDVCSDPMHKDRVFLYEVYADRAAFDAHMASPHFKSFEKESAPWITAKDVRSFERIHSA